MAIAESFPFNERTPVEKATRKNAVDCVKYLNGQPNRITETYRADILENRKYVDAIQDIGKYMEMYGLKKGIDNQYVNYNDINFSPIGIPRTIYKAIYSKLNSIRAVNRVEARDKNSVAFRKDILFDLRTRAKLKEPIQEITGIDISGGKYIPESDIELDVYASMGGLSLPVEVILQDVLKEVDKVNKFDYELNPQINHDIICAAMSAAHAFYDESGIINEQAIDIMTLKIVGGNKRDYTDADGFVIKKKINAQDVYQCVKSYMPNQPTEELPYAYEQSIENLKNKTGMVEVNICYWQCYDKYNKKSNEQGEYRGRSLKKDGDKTTIHKWYTAWNVEGTEIVYNFGPVPNMIRERYLSKYGKAYSPISVLRVDPIYKEINNSTISIIKKFEDMAVSAWLKLQNELSNAKPSGREYNLTKMSAALELVAFNNLQESLDFANKTGDIYTAERDGFDQPASGTAFRDIKGGLSSAFQEYMAIMDFCVRWARDIAGVPALETGAQEDYKKSNFMIQGQMSGANNAILELLETKLYFMQILSEKKLNMILRYAHPSSKIEFPYKTEFSEVKEYVLTNIENLSTIEMGLRVEQEMTEEEINQLKQELLALSQNYRDDNSAGITPLEYLHLNEMLKENPKYATFMLATMQQKRFDKKKQEAQEAQAQNIQAQQQSAMMNNQGKAQVEQVKGQNQLQNSQAQADLDLRNEMIAKGMEAGAQA